MEIQPFCAVFFSVGKTAAPHALAGLHVLNNIPGLEKKGESQAGGRRSTTLKGGAIFHTKREKPVFSRLTGEMAWL